MDLHELADSRHDDELTGDDLAALESVEQEQSEEDAQKELFDALARTLGDMPEFEGEDEPDPPGTTEIVAGSDELTDEDLAVIEEVSGYDSDDYGSDGYDSDELRGDDLAVLDDVEAEARAVEDVLGELFRPDRDAFDRRIADSRPLLRKEDDEARMRDWEIAFGPTYGIAGRMSTITIFPQCLFRCEKIMATDTGSTAGRGTRIVSVAVGQRIQKPNVGRGTLTEFFGVDALANGITFDTAQPWAQIAVTVSFVETCTFDMSLFGRAVVE